MIEEKHKQAGVCYAVTTRGVELPVIDITHPAFALAFTEAELAEKTEQALREVAAQKKIPVWLRKIMFRWLFRKSLLGRGLMKAQGKVLAGMATYMLKLGPENLGQAWSQPVDRKLAETLPSLSSRLRLQDTARQLAEAVIPGLKSDPARPLHLVNIAGGPAMDSLNALILVRQAHPDLLVGRKTVIHILDPDPEGPAFGKRALSALQNMGGPLFHRDIRVDHVRYDWNDSTGLARVLGQAGAEAGIVAGSSEGGLFEYGSDEAVAANLEAFHRHSPQQACMIGTIARADGAGLSLNRTLGAAVFPRGLDAFRSLAGRAGWVVARVSDCPLSHIVSLRKGDK